MLGPLCGRKMLVSLVDLMSLLLDLILHLSQQVRAVLNSRRHYCLDSLVQLCQQTSGLVGKGENHLYCLQRRLVSACFFQLAFQLFPCASAEYLVLASDEGLEAMLKVRETPFLLVDHLEASFPFLFHVRHA